MGKVQDAGTMVAAGAVLLAIAAAPVVWFVHDVRSGNSPSKLVWFLVGLVLFTAGIAAVRGIGLLTDAEEDRLTAVSAVVAIVVTVVGLVAAHQWASSYETSLVGALGPACRGEVVTAAPKQAKPARVVVLDDRGHQHAWTSRSAAWRAEKVGDADLVACVETEDVSLEICRYRGVPAAPPVQEIERFEQVLTVRVVEARTARTVGTFTVTDEPRGCRKVEVAGQGDLHGHVGFAAFSKQLAQFAAG